jgi:hypothetical protein
LVLEDLHTALSKVCPIDGVDGAGLIAFADGASEAQKAAAQAIVTGWDFNAPSQGDYQAALQDHIDGIARAWDYADGAALAGYADAADPEDDPLTAKFKAEGRVFKTWRNSVWSAAYQLLGAVQSGAPAPTVEAFIQSLPVIARPGG